MASFSAWPPAVKIRLVPACSPYLFPRGIHVQGYASRQRWCVSPIRHLVHPRTEPNLPSRRTAWIRSVTSLCRPLSIGPHTQLNPADRVPRPPHDRNPSSPSPSRPSRMPIPRSTSSSRRRSSVRCEHTRRPDYPARRHNTRQSAPTLASFSRLSPSRPSPISPNTAAASSSSRPRTSPPRP